MALIHQYTLLCDEVRQENNGKFFIIGLYTPDVAVPAVPFALPALSFFNVIKSDAPGTFEFTFKFTHLGTVAYHFRHSRLGCKPRIAELRTTKPYRAYSSASTAPHSWPRRGAVRVETASKVPRRDRWWTF